MTVPPWASHHILRCHHSTVFGPTLGGCGAEVHSRAFIFQSTWFGTRSGVAAAVVPLHDQYFTLPKDWKRCGCQTQGVWMCSLWQPTWIAGPGQLPILFHTSPTWHLLLSSSAVEASDLAAPDSTTLPQQGEDTVALRDAGVRWTASWAHLSWPYHESTPSNALLDLRSNVLQRRLHATPVGWVTSPTIRLVGSARDPGFHPTTSSG
ncbi:hypothetical protein R3P38DRAFT_3032233 [Favolaschia claudopus]|uniref:Uncharacterized protein n=1 Tax=Favolaschia claudopus TaxID=2862362 RepID=A0AAW0AE16_9AGAR